MKFLIAGRTGVGKDYLRNLLANDFGWKFVDSYTTRPRRLPSEDTHLFVTEEEAASIPESEKVAKTVINGCEYYATREQIENSDAYIIDPTGIDMILDKMPDERFYIAYIRPSSKETQEEMAIKRAEDPVRELNIFRKRYESENAEFADFEERIASGRLSHENVLGILDISNDYSDGALAGAAMELEALRRFRRNIGPVAYDLMNSQRMDHDEDMRPQFTLSDKSRITMTLDDLSDYLYRSPEMLACVMKDWLTLHTTDLPSYVTARDIDPAVFLENIGPAVENMMGSDDEAGDYEN